MNRWQQRSIIWLVGCGLLLSQWVGMLHGQADESPALPETGTRYQTMTFPVLIDPARYTLPFNASDIELVGIFTAPSGDDLVVPGFWMQPYADICEEPCVNEALEPVGEPTWQVRFTPRETGRWTYTLRVRDDETVVREIEGQFTVVASGAPGFIGVGPNNRYFRYDNGASYFPVGHNLSWSWSGGGGIHAYDEWFESLSAAGGNVARIYVDVPWFIGLEWETVGSYRQEDAARLDRLLELAAAHDIKVQLVLLWHQALTTYNGAPVLLPETPARPDISADWDNNPYNAALGGPLSGPGVFFFDPQATTLFRQRLRYLVARYGHSPQIFAWEIIDEIDQTTTFTPDVADRWLQDMASFIREIDAHDHLITAGSREFTDVVSANPLLDFTTGQFYQRLPIEATSPQVPTLINTVRRNRRLSDRPTLITSYSLNPWYEPLDSDPAGVHLHNSLWAAALSGAAGGAMHTWGETYVIWQDLERYYAPLAAFTAGVDWAHLQLEPVEAGLLVADRSVYQAVRLTEFNRQLRAPLTEPITHTISADGIFPDPGTIPSYLYGQVYDTGLNQPQQYRVVTPVSTYFEVGVRAVSSQAGARLMVAVNDQVRAEFALRAGTTGAAVRVPLPVGEHVVTLNNSGEDWLEMDYIEVGQLIAPARVLSLRDREAGVALAWLQHRDYTWERVSAAEPPEPTEPVIFRYRLDDMPPGRYLAEIWDPLGGAVLGEEVLTVGDDRVFLFDLLPMTRQLALRAFRLPDEPALATPTPAATLTPRATEEALADDLSGLITRVPRSND